MASPSSARMAPSFTVAALLALTGCAHHEQPPASALAPAASAAPGKPLEQLQRGVEAELPARRRRR